MLSNKMENARAAGGREPSRGRLAGESRQLFDSIGEEGRLLEIAMDQSIDFAFERSEAAAVEATPARNERAHAFSVQQLLS
jgi:hypothetical protein